MRASRRVRRRLLDERGECALCGSGEDLEVHHVAPAIDARIVCLLCRRCHREVTRMQFHSPAAYESVILPALLAAALVVDDDG